MLHWRKVVAWPTKLTGRGLAGLVLIVVMLLLLLTAGCAGLRSTLLEADKRPSFLRFGQQEEEKSVVPVVYPAGPTAREMAGRDDNPMTAEFGPAWQGLEPVYREYSFNPFEP
ncbi:hypothetical protein [Desulfurivibrio alkaliphilus]|uniref:Uncharacterized protein n=1 Tax=Desulfurivibrio alkaliphilus (strain DSM 19089 / UNIQEM U267 / AHT2) TaxID=589865 RepID=D6Z4B7_DESAT|nr:hypothetical protein [Desulfurivibrio alkaliphilus]ADH86392.1 hypothetical protein DaAHT2_1700 [Desulfurivibrio alkaliphilus AHT 2]